MPYKKKFNKRNAAARKIQRKFRKRKYRPPGPSVPHAETYKNTIAQDDLTLLNNDWHVEIIKSMSEWLSLPTVGHAPDTATKNVARGYKLNLLNTLCKSQIDCSKLGTTQNQAGVDSVIELQRVVGWCLVPVGLQKSGTISSTRAYEVDGHNYYINLESHVKEALECQFKDTLDFGTAGMIQSFVKKRMLLRPKIVHNHDNHLNTTNRFPTLNLNYNWNTKSHSLVQLSQPARTAESASINTKYNMYMGAFRKVPFYAYRVPGSVVPGKLTTNGDTSACIKIRGNCRSYYKDI